MVKQNTGFSLIELLIVVAIILVIAAIAIPKLLQARIAANESSAVGSVRALNTAQVIFQSAYPTVGYASTTVRLGPSAASGCTTPAATHACLIDWVVAQASTAAKAKSGYYFSDTAAAKVNGIIPGYTLDGIPASLNKTGVRGFCSNQDAVVRFKAVGSAASGSYAACAAYTALQ